MDFWGILRRVLLVTPLLTVGACGPLERSSSKSTQAVAPALARIALGAHPNTGYVSATLAVDVSVGDVAGVCTSQAAAPQACTTAHPNFAAAIAKTSTPTLKFYEVGKGLATRADVVFEVISTTGQSLRKFRLTPAQAGAGGAAALTVAQAAETIQATAMQGDLNFVASDEINGRLSGTPENVKVADWLVEHLKRLGIAPAGDNGSYKQDFKISALGGVTSSNIIGVIPGNDPALKNEYILIGAHMDHAGTLAKGYTCSKGSSAANNICNGADDNGSGTVAVLHVTQALMRVKSQLKRSVIVMWFSGEEEGLVGSKYFVNNPTVPLNNIVYMINLDMVGYLRQNNTRLEAIGANSSKTAGEIAKQLAGRYNSINVKYDGAAQGGSDHAPFMGKGIPAIFFHTGVSSNPHYHKTSDTVEKIDFAGMQNIARFALEHLVRVNQELPAKPIRLFARERPALLPEHELEKSCHHLIVLEEERRSTLDFRYGNDGKVPPLPQAP